MADPHAQVRRDAEQLSAVLSSWVDAQEVRELAGDCLALLAELRQAERVAESVPSLVEALRIARRDIEVVQRAGWDSTRLQFATEAVGRIDAALTVCEQSQGNTE